MYMLAHGSIWGMVQSQKTVLARSSQLHHGAHLHHLTGNFKQTTLQRVLLERELVCLPQKDWGSLPVQTHCEHAEAGPESKAQREPWGCTTGSERSPHVIHGTRLCSSVTLPVCTKKTLQTLHTQPSHSNLGLYLFHNWLFDISNFSASQKNFTADVPYIWVTVTK